jgi:S-DNA-T family DNA segregation ATPase FtsK/SpoIIIE
MSSGFVVRVVAGVSTGATASVEFPIVIGREGDLVVSDPTVSRQHARVEPSEDHVRLIDLTSAGGTAINGQPVRSADAYVGDVVSLGGSQLRILRLVRYSDAAAGPALRIRHQGKERVVAVRDGLAIGREPGCEIQIDDPTVSRRHAIVRISGGGVELEDLDSANGTRVAGRLVRGTITLSDGVAIKVGTAPADLTFSEGAPTGPTQIRLSAEGSSRSDTFAVDASADATVAQVTRELARFVNLPDQELLMYRLDDGALLHPDDRWSSTGIRAGDEYVLGVGNASTYTAAPGRQWPSRSATILNQLPRTVWPEPAHVVERIDPPESTSFRGRGILWQIAGGMGAIAIGLTLVIVNPSYAVFGLITGGIGIISITASILGEQSRRRHRVREYRRKLADLDVALGHARTRQSAALNTLSPTVEELESWVSTSSPRIWERRPSDPDAVRPTIGTGTRATRIEIERPRGSDSPLASELDAVTSRHADLQRVPVIGPGPDTGSLGISGDEDRVRRLITRIVIEAAVLHPPNQLRIWIASTSPGWEWCNWLPHIAGGGPSADVAEASDLLAAAAREILERRAGSTDTLHLIVVPEPSRRLDIEGHRVAARGRDLLVVGSPDRRDLPSGLAVVLDVDARGDGTLIGHYPDAPIGKIEVGGVGEQQAERLSIALGRLGGRARTAAPTGLVELLGLGTATNPNVLGAWQQPPADRLTTAVGSDDSGAPVTIGFRRDGPHGMIAGTTGSGKSELLQTILTGLALRHSPDRLSLFLVDFKGGSTFAPLATLPHVVGLVTDLEHDSSLATRALTALDAEIDRRKRVLEAARVPDVIAYERSEADGHSPLPDLLVVIDEFALLMERQPAVRERLDTIATQGRSLGVHLLLATQSPSGVISHSMRTNTNLWICLRVVTESESLEILGTRDAARIPDGSPGRAIIRLGAAQDLRTFQAARIARPVPDEESPVRVTRLGAGATPTIQLRGQLTTELDVVVGHIKAAAAKLELAMATPLWLPPLPKDLPAALLTSAERPTDRLAVLVGLADQPRQHSQVPFLFDLSASGHALVSGVFGYGKTTALCQIGSDLAQNYSPADVHIYGIDAGAGSLGPLVALPHVGDIVGANEIERLTRLIDRLTRAVESRREQLATAGSGDFLRWRAAGGETPWTVLLVDDYSAFREVAEQVEMGRLLERFNSLLQNGPAVGIHVIVATAQTTDLRSREINLILARLLLRTADSSEYGLVEARFTANEAPSSPPGRGLTTGAVEVQVCRPDVGGFTQTTARWRSVETTRLPRPVLRLPTSVNRSRLGGGRGLLLGVGGNDIDSVEIPIERSSTLLLVAGPSQSGRTSTLVNLIASIQPAADRVLVLAPRPSELRELAAKSGYVVHATTTAVDEALDAFQSMPAPGQLLVIDDAEAISSVSGVSPRLERILREAPEREASVLVAARVNDLPGMFDPWARYLMSMRRVVLLQPTVDDAFLFGVKLPVIPPPTVPGRGLFIDRTRVTVVQVALADQP